MILQVIRSYFFYFSTEWKELAFILLESVPCFDCKYKKDGLRVVFCGCGGVPSCGGCENRYTALGLPTREPPAPCGKQALSLYPATHPSNLRLLPAHPGHNSPFLLCSPGACVWEELLLFSFKNKKTCCFPRAFCK